MVDVKEEEEEEDAKEEAAKDEDGAVGMAAAAALFVRSILSIDWREMTWTWTCGESCEFVNV